MVQTVVCVKCSEDTVLHEVHMVFILKISSTVPSIDIYTYQCFRPTCTVYKQKMCAKVVAVNVLAVMITGHG